jgi:hypothetical protein
VRDTHALHAFANLMHHLYRTYLMIS